MDHDLLIVGDIIFNLWKTAQYYLEIQLVGFISAGLLF